MYYIIVFIVGLLFGSFGSVILHRLSDEITWKKVRSVLIGRSHCPHCKHTLRRYDLFPLFSWLSTGGKCRYCGTKVSHWYPLLELGSGLVFLGIFHRWNLFGGADVPLLLILLFINWCLYLLMVHDIKTMYLHPAAWLLIVVGSIILLLYQLDPVAMILAAQRIFIFGVGFLVFYWFAKVYVKLRRKQNAEGIGQGDVMLAPIIGLVLWKVYALSITTEVASRVSIIQYFRYYVIISCVSALVLLIVIPTTKEEGKRMVPFFPGMIVGVRVMMVIWPRLESLL